MSECVLWVGYLAKNGYGWHHKGVKTVPAHRYVYEQSRGTIPRGLEIDHTCANRGCVNIDHLEAVTHAENMRRAAERRDRCRRGHLWSESTYINPKHGRRECRACNTLRKSQQKRERRQFIDISEEV